MKLIDKLYIRDKNDKRVRYKRNRVQQHFNKHKTGRDIVLKARQMGFTTEIQLDFLSHTLTKTNTSSVTIADLRQHAEDIFRIGKFAWNCLPEEMKVLYKPRYDTRRELTFDATNSAYSVGLETRGLTVSRLHVSEAAFVSNFSDLKASTFEAVPKHGTIVVETTANGMNQFYDFWNEAVAGKNEFKAHFYNWTWDNNYKEEAPSDDSWRGDYELLAKSYNLVSDIQERLKLTDAQFYWYYLKANRLHEKVKQEYPSTADEAFLSENRSVFDLYRVAQIVPKNRATTHLGFEIFYEPEKKHKYIIGVDTSEGVGGDGNAIEVLDATDVKQVASLYDKNIRPDQIAELTVKIATHYKNAFVVPERNGSGLTTVLKLQEIGYNNIYRDRSIDKITKKQKDQLGFRTTTTSRDVLIDDFIEKFDNGEIEINNPTTISQMKTFVRKKNGKREHDQGKNDDSLFALFLAVYGLKYHRSSSAFLDFYKQEYAKEEEVPFAENLRQLAGKADKIPGV